MGVAARWRKMEKRGPEWVCVREIVSRDPRSGVEHRWRVFASTEEGAPLGIEVDGTFRRLCSLRSLRAALGRLLWGAAAR